MLWGTTDWLGRNKKQLSFETNTFAASHLLNSLMLSWLPVSATLLLMQQTMYFFISLPILFTPVAVFARYPSCPGPNTSGPTPSEALK